MEIALHVDSVEEVAARIVEFLEMRMPESLLGKLKMLPKLAEMGAFFPRIVSSAPCQEVVRTERFSLLDYPILQCWPEDGGRFITLPLVFSKNPDTGKRNCGMYRTTAASAWTSRWPSAPTRPPCTPRFCRCRRTSTR
jgi:4-hydroxy-3-polyprenylbenzoate decarboxylase